MNFLDFAAAHGLIKRHIEYDKWRRVPTVDHPHKKNGAYIHTGTMAAVQNWALEQEPSIWHPDDDSPKIDHAALARRRTESTKLLREGREAAARKASTIMDECWHTQHAYLDKKGFPEHRGLVYRPDTDNLLVVPMYAAGKLVGCQMIDVDGTKKFLHGQQAKGAEHIIGRGDLDVWCEGYATALSIHAAAPRMRLSVHICFSAGNLKYLAREGFVIADNDASSTGEAAAKATGLPYFMPPTVGQDFNDLHQAVGLFRASQALTTFLRDARKKT